MTYDPSEHTIDEVHDYLRDHPDEAAAVLAAEQARGDDARSTLVNSLQNSNASPDQQTGEQVEVGEQNIDPVTGRPVGEGYPPGEYPGEGIFGYKSDEPAPEQ